MHESKGAYGLQQLTELMMKLCRMWLTAGMSVGVPGVDPMRVVNGTLSQLFTAPCNHASNSVASRAVAGVECNQHSANLHDHSSLIPKRRVDCLQVYFPLRSRRYSLQRTYGTTIHTSDRLRIHVNN